MYYNDSQGYLDPVSNDLYEDLVEYMPEVPLDPLGEEYEYCTDDSNEKFVLMACLENTGDSDASASEGRCSGVCAISETCSEGVAYYVCSN